MIEFRVRALEETTSTNDEVKAAIDAGEPEGLAVRALRQTGGYGRQGRAWKSPEGGLYLSLLLRPDVEPGRLPTLSLAAGLAVHRALCGLLSPAAAADVRLKWPNDVLCSAGKLCGISLERHGGAVCVGIGVNVFAPAQALDVGGKNRAAYVAQRAAHVTLDEVADAVLLHLGPIYDQWRAQGLAPFVEEIDRLDVLTGREVRLVDQAGGFLAQGRVVCVDDQGRLVLRGADGSLLAVSSGEAHVV